MRGMGEGRRGGMGRGVGKGGWEGGRVGKKEGGRDGARDARLLHHLTLTFCHTFVMAAFSVVRLRESPRTCIINFVSVRTIKGPSSFLARPPASFVFCI